MKHSAVLPFCFKLFFALKLLRFLSCTFLRDESLFGFSFVIVECISASFCGDFSAH